MYLITIYIRSCISLPLLFLVESYSYTLIIPFNQSNLYFRENEGQGEWIIVNSLSHSSILEELRKAQLSTDTHVTYTLVKVWTQPLCSPTSPRLKTDPDWNPLTTVCLVSLTQFPHGCKSGGFLKAEVIHEHSWPPVADGGHTLSVLLLLSWCVEVWTPNKHQTSM